jgi:phospholipase/carboxylesterase
MRPVDRLHLLALAGWLAACHRAPHGDPPGPIEETIEGARVLELFLHGASASSPLVVGLHGRGGSPENFARAFANYPGSIELALVQGFLPTGFGSQWIDVPPTGTDEDLARGIAAAEARLWPIIERVANGRPVIVVGFSQGAFMAWALAAKHPLAIAYAFPVSGGIPAALYPHDHQATAPVHALHGTDDARVSIAFDRVTRDAFVENGSVVDLREFAGQGHAISSEMQADLDARIQQVATSTSASAGGEGAR